MNKLLLILSLFISSNCYAYEIIWGDNSHYETDEIECSTPSKKIKKEIYSRIDIFSNIYKSKTLNKYLKRIYVCKELTRSGYEWFRGTYVEDENSIFIEIGEGEHNDTVYMLHHEFSSLIFLNEFSEKNKENWLQNSNFKYEWYDPFKKDWEDHPDMQQNGALYKYSLTSIENDFNVMAAFYLTKHLKASLELASLKYFRIQQKKEIISEIYKDLIK